MSDLLAAQWAVHGEPARGELEKRGLISRVPGQPRTIKVTLSDDELPRLQPIKTSAVEH
jgi:hypothetical protein